MLTLTLDPAETSVEQVRRRLGLEPGQLDADFGVVEVDPAQHKYAVLVDGQVAARLRGSRGVEGPFSNPRIDPFGPPQA
jgi:hypothetical protein